MALGLTHKMMKGLVVGSFFLTLPLSIEISFAATKGRAQAPLNFRASPNGKDIGGVSRGERFTVLDTTASWVKIKRSNGRVGWVWKKYVQITRTSSSRSTQTSSSVQAIAKGVTTARKGLNIRRSPSTGSRDIGSLRPGHEFEILSEAENGWYKIRSADGKVGYASSRYIKKTETLRVANIPIPTPRPTRPGETSAVRESEAAEIPAATQEQADALNPHMGDSLISAYAPTPSDLASSSEAAKQLSQLVQDEPGESLSLASADTAEATEAKEESTSNLEAECDDCLVQTASLTGPNREVFDIGALVYDFHVKEQAQSMSQSKREKCYGEVILKAAKENVRRRFGNRSYSGGVCAYGVRTSLQRAGVNRVGSLGDAIKYHKQSSRHEGTLAQLGFVNEISKYKSAKNAPPGAVLVYGGPYSDRLLRNPGRYYSRSGRIVRRHGGSAGDYVGHVTIKGDDGRYYTDGRTRNPAIANRHLVGIYVLKECKSCTAEVKRKCGG